MQDWFKARNIWGAGIETLSDAEAGRLAKAIWAYTMRGEEQELFGAEKAIYTLVLMTLRQDEETLAELSQKRADAGSKGGKQKVANSSKSKQNVANQANATIKNKNKNKETDKENIVILTDNLSARTAYGDAVNAYNDLCVPPLPAVRQLSETRKQHIKTGVQKLNKAGMNWQGYFTQVSQSDFLMGRTGSWHGCGFDWLIKPANMLKVLEGNYNRLTPEQEQEQRDREELEAWMERDEL